MLPLELELDRRAKAGDAEAQACFENYKNIKKILAEDYYPWIHDKCPFFTDHGEFHINAIIIAAGNLLENRLKCDEKELRISTLELYLLLSSIVWHDVGMLYGRNHHALNVSKIMDQLKVLYNNPSYQRVIVQIARGHSGEGSLNTIEKEALVSNQYGNTKINIRSLAAILRFCDEISENSSRISHRIFDVSVVPEENIVFWEYASCIVASLFEPRLQKVTMDIQMPFEKAHQEYKYLNNKITLIEYIIMRLEKINNERIICAPEFRIFADINLVEVKLSLFNKYDKFTDYDTTITFCENYYYPVPIVDKFFADHYKWKPEMLKKFYEEEVLHD